MSEITREYRGNGRKVRIKDAYKGDAGRGRIRIDLDLIIEMNLETGDVIEIAYPIAGKKTAALLFPGKDEDRGSNSIRIDSSLRRNLSASLDVIVEIQKIDASLADRITFAGLEESVILRRSEQLVRMLENRVITKGDILSFNAMGRRIDFIVVDFFPKAAAVRIHLDTKITISEKTHEELESRRVTYEDIGGMSDVIQKVREIMELPLKHPELFQKMGIESAKGIILHGKPGTGKTLLVRALTYETGIYFITIDGPEILKAFEGKTEERFREIFRNAKANAPSIIFFDKIDAIAPKEKFHTDKSERRVIAQLLTLMDGLRSRGEVIIIAETNRIENIDEAFRRPGRFDIEIEIKSPDLEGRYEILKIYTRGVPLHGNVNLRVIAEKTHDFVGADLKALVREAALLPIREILPSIEEDTPVPSNVLDTLQIKMEHFLAALESIKHTSLK